MSIGGDSRAEEGLGREEDCLMQESRHGHMVKQKNN